MSIKLRQHIEKIVQLSDEEFEYVLPITLSCYKSAGLLRGQPTVYFLGMPYHCKQFGSGGQESDRYLISRSMSVRLWVRILVVWWLTVRLQ
jgi:hypothetical protein